MIDTIRNVKWIVLTSLVSIILGLLTFFTFINQSFIELNEFNIQLLLILDLFLITLFFILIIKKTIVIFNQRKSQKHGSKTSLRYVVIFSLATLLPSVLISIFSLVLFNVGLQNYFNEKITSAVNNSYDVAKNYVEETRNTITADVLMVAIDINRATNSFYDNPNKFNNVLRQQRLLRRLDEIYLLDSAGNIIYSNLIDSTRDYVPPLDEAIVQSISGKPIRITDALTNRTSAVLKLSNFIDTYLYIVRFMDPKVIGYLRDTEQAINFYYSVENSRTGIKITFALIYLIVVSLLLFLSVTVAINLASGLTRPIVNLIGASEKISSGDLDAKVPLIKTDDEFQKLNENFNLMIERLKIQQDKLLISERYEAWEKVARKLAHEIKNPLTPIQLSIDRIQEKYLNKIDKDKDQFSNYLLTINKQIKDIEKLVNEFSDFARMPKPILKKINLEKVINRSIELNKLSKPEIHFNIKVAKENLFIRGDEEQLNRVFINLIKNSIESLEDKVKKTGDFTKKIDIDIYDNNDYIYTEIEDNGVGFGDVDTKNIITPYYTTKKNGTGLGLAIVTKIINDHDGKISFKSVKNGARVIITIPKTND